MCACVRACAATALIGPACPGRCLTAPALCLLPLPQAPQYCRLPRRLSGESLLLCLLRSAGAAAVRLCLLHLPCTLVNEIHPLLTCPPHPPTPLSFLSPLPAWCATSARAPAPTHPRTSHIAHAHTHSTPPLFQTPPCVVSDFCSRGSLNDVLKAAKDSPSKAAQLDWTRRINMALDAAKGMVGFVGGGG